MNPHGFDLRDIFGAACLVFALGFGFVIMLGLVSWALDKLTGSTGGLMDRSKRKR